jgi:hypothetical protein
MASEIEKEEIIELTEVLEEGPAFAGRKERLERLSPEPEGKRVSAPPPAVGESPSDLSGSDAERLKEILTREAQAWLANRGAPILERIAREVFPQIAEKVLRQEIEKLKEEGRGAEKE